jgi:hypothetical protein
VCLDAIDNEVLMSRSTWEKAHDERVLQQCDLCARWRSDVAYVPVLNGNDVSGHWVCGRCEQEAENNWFLARALSEWEKKKAA